MLYIEDFSVHHYVRFSQIRSYTHAIQFVLSSPLAYCTYQLLYRCTLVEMLNFYGVKLSHALQTKLDTHLVLPGKSSGITEDDIQQRLSQSNSQIELEPEEICC